MDTFGSQWYRVRFLREGRLPAMPWDYGYRSKRRREEAILVQQGISWRARAAGLSSTKLLDDMTNAFACTHHEELRKTVETLPSSGYYVQRIVNATIIVTTADGTTLAVRNTTGGLMGERNAAEMFAGTFNPKISLWNLRMARHLPYQSGKMGWATCGITGKKIDVSLCTFADDLAKELSVPRAMQKDHGAYESLQTLISTSNEYLDETLEDGGWVQNKSKQLIMPSIVGTGAKYNTRRFYANENGLEGTISNAGRCLGPMINMQQSVTEEKAVRCQTIRNGWRAMGALWWSDVPYSTKRIFFMSRVQAPALTAQEVMNSSPTVHRIYDKMLSKYLRVMMKGAASGAVRTVNDEGKTEIAYKPMRTKQVWRYWRLVPTALEVRRRRIAWYQELCREPEYHLQVLAILFGTMAFESEDTLVQGRVAPDANPWALRFEEDILSLNKYDDGLSVLALMQNDLRRLFTDPETREAFMSFDTHAITSEYWSVAVPPPGTHLEAESESSATDENAVWHYCRVCSLKFKTRSAMCAHLRTAHGFRIYLRELVITSQCFWCKSWFRSKDAARTHVVHSYAQQRCLCDLAVSAVEPRTPDALDCPVDCGFTAQDLPQLQRHIAGVHAPTDAPDLILWPDVVESRDNSGERGDRRQAQEVGRRQRQRSNQEVGSTREGRRGRGDGRRVWGSGEYSCSAHRREEEARQAAAERAAGGAPDAGEAHPEELPGHAGRDVGDLQHGIVEDRFAALDDGEDGDDEVQQRSRERWERARTRPTTHTCVGRRRGGRAKAGRGRARQGGQGSQGRARSSQGLA